MGVAARYRGDRRSSPLQRLRAASDGSRSWMGPRGRLARSSELFTLPDRTRGSRLPAHVRGGPSGYRRAGLGLVPAATCSTKSQLRAVDRVLAQLVADDRADRHDHRHRRRRGACRPVRRERVDDPLRPAAGALRASPDRPGWLPFIFGCIAGVVPWIAIGIYLWARDRSAEPPAFVYAIFVSLFVFFNSFALNMVLQYRRDRPVAELPVRRVRVRGTQPGREVGAGLAGLREHARAGLSAPAPHRPLPCWRLRSPRCSSAGLRPTGRPE